MGSKASGKSSSARSASGGKGASRPSRGALARPLESLVFLLPLIIFYEIASHYEQRVIAFDLLHMFISLFGELGTLAPALLVVAVMLATHVASGEPWKVRWSRVLLLYGESIGLALPLVFVSQSLFQAGTIPQDQLFERVSQGVGAGIYEEMVFRLLLLSMLVMIGADVLGMRRPAVALGAVVLSSLVFSAHHFEPIGREPFTWPSFVFKACAGAYLACIFWWRGYGSAAGSHAAYNVIIILTAADAWALPISH